MALTQVNAGLIDSTSQPNSFKNRIINGAMMIDQRNAGAAVTVDGATPYTLDRWQGWDTTDGAFTFQQVAVTDLSGFSNALKVTVTTADSSLGATQLSSISQNVEGLNVADLNWGTVNAKTVTLSFWAQSSLTGTFGGAIENSATNRSYPFTYSIPVANTWTQISVTIAGDTTGTWLATNGIGMRIWINLGTGSTYSGTAGSWAAADYRSATGATSVVGTNGATFYITGVQLEKGSTATSFDYRPYGTEYQLCQRYYNKITGSSRMVGRPGIVGGANTAYRLGLEFPVVMRTAPTLSLSSGVRIWDGSATPVIGSASTTYNADEKGCDQDYSGGSLSGLTTNRSAIYYFIDTSQYIAVSAEL